MQLKRAIDEFIQWKGVAARGSTVSGYACDLRIFCILLKNRQIEDIGLQDIMGVINDMLESGWTQNSMMRKCMALRKFLEFCQLKGYDVIPKDLIPIPRPLRKLPRVADEDDFSQLLSVIPSRTRDPRHVRNQAIIRLLWDTGLRNGELCSLDVEDVDTDQLKGVVRTEKNRGSRTHRPFFWTKKTNDSLKEWLSRRGNIAAAGDNALFVSCCNVKSGQRLQVKGICEMLRKYSAKANLPTINAHSFRHHLGHHIINKGGSNSDVANILGHSSLLSTFTYTQMDDPEVEMRYRRLND